LAQKFFLASHISSDRNFWLQSIIFKQGEKRFKKYPHNLCLLDAKVACIQQEWGFGAD